MKQGSISILLAGLVMAALCSGCATSGSGAGGRSTARIKALDGSAEISHAGGPWETARLWQTLHSGDRARTGPQGRIDFSLGKYGGVLTLMPESAIEFQQLGPAAADAHVIGIINLTEGRVVGDTLKLPPETRLQIKTLGGTHEIP